MHQLHPLSLWHQRPIRVPRRLKLHHARFTLPARRAHSWRRERYSRLCIDVGERFKAGRKGRYKGRDGEVAVWPGSAEAGQEAGEEGDGMARLEQDGLVR